VTFSIVARTRDSAGRDAWGVAVASRFLAVGAAVPAAECGAGALATQAWANLAYRPDGLAQLRAGRTAHEVVARLTSADDQRARRQLGVVDAAGWAASYTGQECMSYAGSRTGDGVAVQGNILTGPEVLDAMVAAWDGSAAPAGQLATRLTAALAAGDAAGGDRRGRQSAAVLVVSAGRGYGGATDVMVDLRVDEHPHPVVELARLLDLHELYFGTPDPATVLPLQGGLADEVALRVRQLGFDSLLEWMGMENYEDRHVDGAIDPLVLGKLREASA
jgi:uncharacterized Ntn-hydrolase superfamily protein